MLTLRPFQKAALDALERPGNVLCIAPTGSGKSLIYERASDKPGRRTLLVTPLVALARQQGARLGERARSNPAGGGSGVWISSPERLQMPGTLEALRRWKPDFLVVDECHCLWDWGESFRPAFRAVPPLIRELGIRSSLWLTATLPGEAREELRAAISPLTEIGEFDLPARLELAVARVPWPERASALLGWLEQRREPGILFAQTRESVRRLTRLIEATGRGVACYHAGMGAEERRAIEARLEAGLPSVVVATSAFGLGMHYPGLRWAALWQAPLSLLALAQAAGRVGRDPGSAALALVLWDDEDFRTVEWALRGSRRQARQAEQVRDFLASRTCRRAALRAYFAIRPENGDDSRCGSCDICSCKNYTNVL